MKYTGYTPISICYSFWGWVFTTWDLYVGLFHVRGIRILGHEWEERKQAIFVEHRHDNYKY